MKSKKILIIVISLIMIIATIIPSFALVSYADVCKTIPSDLGTRITSDILGTNEDMLYKFYIAFRINYDVNNSYYMLYKYIDDDGNYVYGQRNFLITYNESTNTISINYYNLNTEYSNLTYPVFNDVTELNEWYYLPVYTYNITEMSFYNANTNYSNNIYVYSSLTTDEETLINEAYQIGYNNGYQNGYNDGIPAGAGILEDLNFVENIEMLIGKFTGDNYAQYITPIAIVLAILLVYFIFIRFLLSLIKAKGVIKVCDIVTLVACISILVVMYLPMIDFTITQHQLVEQVYSVAADVTP